MPFGFHLTMDTLPSGAFASGGCRSALAVSGFRLRARLGFSIPSISLRPARHYPRFWIQRPSSGRRRDFNPPEQCAAQRTLRPLLTSRSGSHRHPFRHKERSPQVRTHSFTARPPDLRRPPWSWVMGASRSVARSPWSASPSIRCLSIGPQLRSTLPPHTRSPSCSCASLRPLGPAYDGTYSRKSAPMLGAP